MPLHFNLEEFTWWKVWTVLWCLMALLYMYHCLSRQAMCHHFLVSSRETSGVLWDSVDALFAYYGVVTNPWHYRLINTVGGWRATAFITLRSCRKAPETFISNWLFSCSVVVSVWRTILVCNCQISWPRCTLSCAFRGKPRAAQGWLGACGPVKTSKYWTRSSSQHKSWILRYARLCIVWHLLSLDWKYKESKKIYM